MNISWVSKEIGREVSVCTSDAREIKGILLKVTNESGLIISSYDSSKVYIPPRKISSIRILDEKEC